MDNKKTNPFISIIVPVYNVEKYIRECVLSLMQQTMKNIEIILIDDGSEDNSGKICDELGLIDDRVKVFHKTNGGLSDARNYGIEKAIAKYILLVDSDDCIRDITCEELYKIAQMTNADMISFKCLPFKQDIPKKFSKDTNKTINMNSNTAGIKYLYGEYIQNSACSKLYKKELFRDISFPVGMLAEDYATTYLFIERSNCIVYYDKTFYFYRQRSDSIMHEASLKLVMDTYDIHCRKYEFESKHYIEHRRIIETRFANRLLKTMARLLNEHPSQYDKEISIVAKKLEDIQWNILPISSRIIYFIYSINRKYFALFMKIIRRNG